MLKKSTYLLSLFFAPILNAVTFGTGEIDRIVGIFNNQKYSIQLTDPRDVEVYKGRSFYAITESAITVPSRGRRYFRMQPGSNFSLTVQSNGKRKTYRVVVQTFEVPKKGKVSLVINPDREDKLIEAHNMQVIIGDPLLV